MPNILDTVQISGSSYDLKDKNATSVSAVTQQEYDNLPSSAKTSNTFFVITDAQAGDLTQYWTSAQTQSAITQATSGKASQSDLETVSGQVANKQDLLVSGTNIKTINNTSLLGSGNIDIQGGSTYTAGRGISIANDTISFSLPISAGTGTNSIAEGNRTIASGESSHAEGYYTKANGSYSHTEGGYTTATTVTSVSGLQLYQGYQSRHAEGCNTLANNGSTHAEGYYTQANNFGEHASGVFNVSSTASTSFGHSGNTLFSVGNGINDYTRHNAFEIRQNGDIYLTKDGQDVKLQDQLGGSSITVDSALSSTSENPVQNKVIYNKFDEVEQVTAAGLNALNDKFDGLKLKKLTQTEFNNLQTKDNNTLYVIVN